MKLIVIGALMGVVPWGVLLKDMFLGQEIGICIQAAGVCLLMLSICLAFRDQRESRRRLEKCIEEIKKLNP